MQPLLHYSGHRKRITALQTDGRYSIIGRYIFTLLFFFLNVQELIWTQEGRERLSGHADASLRLRFRALPCGVRGALGLVPLCFCFSNIDAESSFLSVDCDQGVMHAVRREVHRDRLARPRDQVVLVPVNDSKSFFCKVKCTSSQCGIVYNHRSTVCTGGLGGKYRSRKRTSQSCTKYSSGWFRRLDGSSASSFFSLFSSSSGAFARSFLSACSFFRSSLHNQKSVYGWNRIKVSLL